jgi:multisubunit Na+/H+ antiporter MnhB subunit
MASNTGLTSSCIFTVSVSDVSGDTGSSGTSNEALIVNSATGQTVPINIATNPIIAGKSTLVSASLSSLSFSNPVYSWSATGCPDFTNPSGVSSFTYNSLATGITTNCMFTVSVSDPYGNNGFGTSALLTVSPVGSQTVPISISTNPITTGGSTTVAANVSGLVFSNPTYSWSTSGTCPDFTNPGNVQSFTYTASATGTTLGCTFTVSVSDSSDNTGSGATVDALVVNSATGQTVPVSIATNPITLNGSTTVSASVSGLVFSNPAYLWSITGCPDFVSPGSVSSFTYTASATGLTSDCVFTVSVTDTYGNTGTGVSAALAVNQPSQATTTSTSTTVNTTTTMAQQNATVQAQPVTTVPTITVPASAAAVVPAAAPAASSNNSYLIGVTGIVIVIVATLLYYRSTGRLGRSRRGRRHY